MEQVISKYINIVHTDIRFGVETTPQKLPGQNTLSHHVHDIGEAPSWGFPWTAAPLSAIVVHTPCSRHCSISFESWIWSSQHVQPLPRRSEHRNQRTAPTSTSEHDGTIILCNDDDATITHASASKVPTPPLFQRP
jgi:hypothetical protein